MGVGRTVKNWRFIDSGKWPDVVVVSARIERARKGEKETREGEREKKKKEERR